MSLLLLFQSAGSSDVNVTPGIDTLVLTGNAPTVTATSNVTVTPGIDTLVITGYAPTVTVPTSVSVTPGVGSLTFTGYAPTVSNVDPNSGSKGGGIPDPYYYKKRKKKPVPAKALEILSPGADRTSVLVIGIQIKDKRPKLEPLVIGKSLGYRGIATAQDRCGTLLYHQIGRASCRERVYVLV